MRSLSKHELVEASRRLFQIALPLALRSEPIHVRAVCESTLCGGDIVGLTGPDLLRLMLQGAAIRERDRPWERSHLIHQVQMQCRFLIRLAAREEGDSGNRRRHAFLQDTD